MKKLPSWDVCKERIENGESNPLEEFIFENEPKDDLGICLFREKLLEVVNIYEKKLDALEKIGHKYAHAMEYYDESITGSWEELTPFAKRCINGIGIEILGIIKK